MINNKNAGSVEATEGDSLCDNFVPRHCVGLTSGGARVVAKVVREQDGRAVLRWTA
jgi:hypothetical protein